MYFGNLLENQQLLIVFQLIHNIPITDKTNDIRYVHSCANESTFLQKWKEEMLKTVDVWSIQHHYKCSIQYLEQCFSQMSTISKEIQ